MRLAPTLSIVLTVASLAVAAAPLVPWSEAGRHVGKLVTLEGFVTETRRDGRRVTLIFDADDPRAVRITLLIPLVTDLPPEPETLYRSRRVQVFGRVLRAAGRLDVVVTDPDRITVEGLTSDGSSATGPDTLPEPVPPPAPPTPGSTTVPAKAVPTSTIRASPRQAARDDAAAEAAAACARLATSRDAARRRTLDAVEALRDCLREARAGCSATADRVAAPLARLEAIEQAIRARCPAPR